MVGWVARARGGTATTACWNRRNRAAFFVYPDDGLVIIVLTNLVGGNAEKFIPQIAELCKSLPGKTQQ